MSSLAVDVETVKKEVDCPHCKGKFDLEIQRKKPKVQIEEQETTRIQTEHTHEHATESPKKDAHEELAEMLPRGVNFGKCANGNCGKKIKNAKGLTTKYKACPNCRANTVPKNNDYCPTCGKEPEEWDDSEVELETGEEE